MSTSRLPSSPLCTLVVLAASVHTAHADDAARISPNVTAFLATHCARCHGPEEQNAEVRFDTMPKSIADGTAALQWQDVLDVLNLGEMPPEGEPRPPREETSNAIEALTGNLLEARERLADTGGKVVVRRLNRREYARTIDALFGVPVDVSMLPEDAIVDGFDTNGGAQGFSSLHLERYLMLGRRVLDAAYPTSGKRPKPVRQRHEPEGEARKIREEIPRLEKKVEGFDKSIAAGRKDHVLRRDISRTEIALSNDYLSRPETATGTLVPFHGLNPSTWTTSGREPPTGTYAVRVRLGIVADNPPDDVFLQVVRGEYRSKVPDDITYHHLTGTYDEPQTIAFTYEVDNLRSNRLTFSRRDVRRETLEKYADARDYFFKYRLVEELEEDTRPDLWIDWVEIEGPLPENPAPLSESQLFGDRKVAELDDTEIRTLVERFAYEAFRHETPDPAYVDRLIAIHDASLERGDEPLDALKDALTVVLATPRFLFLGEPKADDEPRGPLSEREIAVRLAYFLWSAPPDEDLYRAAESGSLRSDEGLAEQVERMLDSPRSRAFVENFATQWLELDRLQAIDPSAAASPHYDEAVHRQSRREVVAFLETMMRDNRPITSLVESDFLVVDALMAEFYGVDRVVGDEFRVVPRPAGDPRGGLLGQSAILTLTGTGDRTSPVERGAFVLRKLLNRPPPPAPANVPMLDEETVGTRSIRETLARHQTNPQCASCHRRIDPLGFALENFDPVGRWREEVRSVDGSLTFPVNARGTMPDGRSFAGPLELKQRLLEDRRAFTEGLAEAMMTYGLGRSIGFSDQETVAAIVAETEERDHRLRALIHAIVRSEAFRTR